MKVGFALMPASLRRHCLSTLYFRSQTSLRRNGSSGWSWQFLCSLPRSDSAAMEWILFDVVVATRMGGRLVQQFEREVNGHSHLRFKGI